MKVSPIPTDVHAHWSGLWRSGVLHSCSQGIGENYDAEIGMFWRQCILDLPERATVLDVGTGNGAILLLARQLRPDLRLIGVDLADIDPVAHMADGARLYAGIHFHPRTAMQSLPVPAASVDLLTSQYAFEYAPEREALLEFRRVLSPTGRLAMIVHGDGTEIARISGLQLHACAMVLADDGVLALAAALVQQMASAAGRGTLDRLGNDPLAEQTRHRFNNAAQQLLDHAVAQPDTTVFARTAQILRQALAIVRDEPDNAIKALQQGRQLLLHEQQRLKEFQRAARSAAQMRPLCRWLDDNGLPARFEALHYRGTSMGWKLVAGGG